MFHMFSISEPNRFFITFALPKSTSDIGLKFTLSIRLITPTVSHSFAEYIGRHIIDQGFVALVITLFLHISSSYNIASMK
jgi:hypothetical protein